MEKIKTKLHYYLNENYKNNDWIICYHRSNNKEHLIDADFSLEKSDNENSVFGKAIYFASSPDISSQLGRYKCKYKIKLVNPLNLNTEITNNKANKLLKDFINRYNVEIKYYDREEHEDKYTYDFNDDYYKVQYGEFFLQLSDITTFKNHSIQYYYDFIKNVLGYDSFYHYSDYGTNFITEKGDYGYCYGLLYDDKDKIKFVDGIF